MFSQSFNQIVRIYGTSRAFQSILRPGDHDRRSVVFIFQSSCQDTGNAFMGCRKKDYQDAVPGWVVFFFLPYHLDGFLFTGRSQVLSLLIQFRQFLCQHTGVLRISFTKQFIGKSGVFQSSGGIDAWRQDVSDRAGIHTGHIHPSLLCQGQQPWAVCIPKSFDSFRCQDSVFVFQRHNISNRSDPCILK